MKWRLLGAVLTAASLVQREPERGALEEFASELGQLDRPAPSTSDR